MDEFLGFILKPFPLTSAGECWWLGGQSLTLSALHVRQHLNVFGAGRSSRVPDHVNVDFT